MKILSTGWLKQSKDSYLFENKKVELCGCSLGEVLGVSVRDAKRVRISVYDKPVKGARARFVIREKSWISIYTARDKSFFAGIDSPPKSWMKHVLLKDWPKGRVVYLKTEVER